MGGGGGGEGGGRGSSNATVDGVTEWSGLTERERERGKSGRVSQSHSDGEKRRSKQSEVKHETPESPLLLLSHYPIEWRRGDSFSSVALCMRVRPTV